MTTLIKTNNIGERFSHGENCIIGPGAVIGDNVIFGHNVIIEGDVIIGDNVHLHHGVCIGGAPQHPEYLKKRTGKIIIGDNTVLREFCTVHLPTVNQTSIGKNCLIMNHVSIGHDVTIKDNANIANGAQIGGTAYIDNNVILGLNCCIHQDTYVGSFAMVGMRTQIRNTVPPFCLLKNEKKSFNMIGYTRNKHLFDVSSTEILKYFKFCMDGTIIHKNLQFNNCIKEIFYAYKQRLEHKDTKR